MIDSRKKLVRHDEKVERADFLESLGFEINHLDSSVECAGLEFDFSAIAMNSESIIYHAVIKAYEMGVEDGKMKAKNDILEALGINK